MKNRITYGEEIQKRNLKAYEIMDFLPEMIYRKLYK